PTVRREDGMGEVEPVAEIACRHRRASQLDGPQLRAAGNGEHEGKQAAVPGNRAGIAVIRARQQRFGGPARVRRSTIQVEERALARVNQLPTIGRPFGAEVPATPRGEAYAARAPHLEHPDVPQGVGRPDVDRYAAAVRGEARVGIAIPGWQRAHLVALAVNWPIVARSTLVDVGD